MLKAQIDADLKAAMLGGDKDRATILRGLKSVILYEEVAKGLRETGLDDESIQSLFAREAKKRQEAADLYTRAGESARAEKELQEKTVIEGYLPQQLSDEELGKIVDGVLTSMGENAQMGQAIGAVKAKVGNLAEGSRIAAAVKAKIG